MFGSPAQIFLRPTIRNDKKLSDRSVSGTLVGISDKGNGYIFLIKKLNSLVEVDSKDAKFNETFADVRELQGKLTNAQNIEPDLTIERDDHKNADDQDRDDLHENNENDEHHCGDSEGDVAQKRQRRQAAPRLFLLPGTHEDTKARRSVGFVERDEREDTMIKNLCKATDKWEAAIAMQPFTDEEIKTRIEEAVLHNKDRENKIRQLQYSHLCLEGIMNEYPGTTLILDCMEAQTTLDTKLLKELELLTACTLCENDDELMMSTFANELNVNQDINLNIPDPKSQSKIDRMLPRDAARFNNATIAEVNGMKWKNVFEYVTMDNLPQGTQIYQSIVNWTSKTNLGIYVKMMC